MITIRLVGPHHMPAPDKFTEVFSSHFVPSDHIEHLWSRTTHGRIDLVLFLLAECEAEALLIARAACLRALTSAPLKHWRLSDDPHFTDEDLDGFGTYDE